MVSQALSKPFDSFKTIALQYLLTSAPFVAEHLDIGEACEILKIAVTHYTVEQKAMAVSNAATLLSRSERWGYRYRRMVQDLVQLRDQLPMHLEVPRRRPPPVGGQGTCRRGVGSRPRYPVSGG